MHTVCICARVCVLVVCMCVRAYVTVCWAGCQCVCVLVYLCVLMCGWFTGCLPSLRVLLHVENVSVCLAARLPFTFVCVRVCLYISVCICILCV